MFSFHSMPTTTSFWSISGIRSLSITMNISTHSGSDTMARNMVTVLCANTHSIPAS